MMYANDPEHDTGDWIRLNFNEEDGPLIAHVLGDDTHVLCRLGQPEEPDIEEPSEPDEPDEPDEPTAAQQAIYDTKMAAYVRDLREYEKVMDAYTKVMDAYTSAVDDFESPLCDFPVAQHCMWSPRNRVYDDQIAALIEAGFVVYSVLDTELPLPFSIVFGVDGGGYSFVDDHWIPLRAIVSRIAAGDWRDHEGSRERHNALVASLALEIGSKSGRASFVERYEIRETQ